MVNTLEYDIILLTDARYLHPEVKTPYVQNILQEAQLIRSALEKKGLRVGRLNWDAGFDWSTTRYALFRTTWDYFDRFAAFSEWLDKASKQTQLVNPIELIRWNLDKHYLQDLALKGLPIPPTRFIEAGNPSSLTQLVKQTGWAELVLKPAVSGAARHTYRFKAPQASEHEAIFQQLIAKEAMLLQEFQQNVLSRGEVAFMAFGGQYSHAILKKAKPGDFRVQDDFGGTVHPYTASAEEIELVEQVLAAISPTPAYARVDVIWDNQGQPVISEVELVEPELWFREAPQAAQRLAEVIAGQYF